ncbi:DUF2255 family protein, partial [Streptomyces sp. NPDC059837]|uniref:DUF2255 family protein n=1 Tax=Streptomyces sp. NPDC059837 TaxID=3346968 RepID=UPI0036554A8A
TEPTTAGTKPALTTAIEQNGPTVMTSEAIATVEAYFEAFGTRDMERILVHFAPDATWTIPGDPALTPWAGSRTGPEEIGQSLTAFFAAVEPLAFELQPLAESDGRVLVPGRYASRFHPSGQVLESEMILRFTVVDGLITDYRVFEDSLGITRAYLGEVVTAAPAAPTKAWASDELDQIAKADELEMAPLRRDGTTRTPVPIWVVRDGEDLYVRSFRGSDGGWWRTARASHEGHIRSGRIDKDVTFIEVADPEVNDRIDSAYRTKYGRFGGAYVDPMVAARPTTLKLVPR